MGRRAGGFPHRFFFLPLRSFSQRQRTQSREENEVEKKSTRLALESNASNVKEKSPTAVSHWNNRSSHFGTIIIILNFLICIHIKMSWSMYRRALI